MDLGLGALCSTGINNWSMEEELELTVRCADARASIMDTFYMIESAVDSLEHLIAVQTVIKQHGCTESIAYLYGENNIDMSVEGLGDTIKGVLKKIYEFIIELKNKIVSFFKNLFPKKKDSVKKATEEAKKVEEEVAKEKLQDHRSQSTSPNYAIHTWIKLTVSFHLLTLELTNQLEHFVVLR